jgi:hypothetical protein
MQSNFILTDVMKSGFHMDLQEFIGMHSMKDQTFECTGEYYALHNYDLDSYDRRFAIIDTRKGNAYINVNPEYHKELQRRCDLLHSQGFVFIKANPWESIEFMDTTQAYPIIDIKHVLWTGDVSWFWFYMYRKHLNNNYSFTHKEKTYDFLYLNKQPRPHRIALYEKVLPLMSNSLYTRWDKGIKLPMEYELPWAQDYPVMGKDQDIFEKPYNDTKYNLVSESNDNNTDIFMTEKIWKPIIAQQVFVVHGNYLYLQKLREMGFKTFGNYFDETYDLEKNGNDRVDAICKLCKDLLEKDWQDIYLQTIALRQHNYDNFFNKERLQKQINNTLIRFLEFADSGQVSS